MIERLQSRNRKNIVKYQGRLLASSVDPVREANNWVQKHLPRIIKNTHIIVLGAGCGYHLVALKTAHPSAKILCIESEGDLIAFCQAEHSLDLAEAQFICEKTKENLKRNSRLQKFIHHPYIILKAGSATTSEGNFFIEAEELLLGRTQESFDFIVAHRSDLNELFKLESSARNASVTGALISIKGIEALVSNMTETTASMIFRALRELVN